jgi:hypothetical protein
MMPFQLWEILIELEQPKNDRTLTCNQCFAIVDLLSLAIELDIDREQLFRLVQRHLARCPGCREKLLAQLEELEQLTS